MANVNSDEAQKAKKSLESEYNFGTTGWKIKSVESHILTKEQEETFTVGLKLPHLPDMVFSQNALIIARSKNDIKFTPYDALKSVNDHDDLVHVAGAKEWLDARKESAHLHKIVHPYDWTYTPANFKGTTSSSICIASTDEKIDYEKLKKREQILFYKDIVLYEDELDDNGCSKLSIKIRVMPSGFFCLQRFYLRVDNTLIRVIDTRLYCSIDKPKEILREYSERECTFAELSSKKVPPNVLVDQNEIVEFLNVKKQTCEKLDFGSDQ